MLAAVYAVPDPVVGDQVMAAVQLRPGATRSTPTGFAAFLAAQADLGTKWAPRFVRMSATLPLTATNKVMKRCCAPSGGTAPSRAVAADRRPLRGARPDEAAALEEAVGDRPL